MNVPDQINLRAWRKSSYSSGNGGSCVEVADGYDVLPVRDSKTPDGPVLTFRHTDWTAFVTALRSHDLR
ncbi:DUF397 domain-containing protein [Streptomyces sp. P38-E01]|uniref:DUF397 domain-containing protein n=1 Tax=Streptomyces tardus TaxID=2780544 RepID=A0A949JE28_9ACTN|nr:DUF397 domain-containing protein [Streptomyces tardus]MBU7598352.1 DUF397 domain-containing protein [Streptomyces tardus]